MSFATNFTFTLYPSPAARYIMLFLSGSSGRWEIYVSLNIITFHSHVVRLRDNFFICQYYHLPLAFCEIKTFYFLLLSYISVMITFIVCCLFPSFNIRDVSQYHHLPLCVVRLDEDVTPSIHSLAPLDFIWLDDWWR